MELGFQSPSSLLLFLNGYRSQPKNPSLHDTTVFFCRVNLVSKFPSETCSLSSFPISFPGTTIYSTLTGQKCREPQCLFSPPSSNDQIFSALPSKYRINQALLPPPVFLVLAVIIHRSRPRTTWPQLLGFSLSRPPSTRQPENESHSVVTDSL